MVTLPGLMNSAVTSSGGTMDSKLDFINKSIDPIKDIEIDYVNFLKYDTFNWMIPIIVQALGFKINHVTVILPAASCFRDVCFGRTYRTWN